MPDLQCFLWISLEWLRLLAVSSSHYTEYAVFDGIIRESVPPFVLEGPSVQIVATNFRGGSGILNPGSGSKWQNGVSWHQGSGPGGGGEPPKLLLVSCCQGIPSLTPVGAISMQLALLHHFWVLGASPPDPLVGR